jgi:hypothetical protein
MPNDKISDSRHGEVRSFPPIFGHLEAQFVQKGEALTEPLRVDSAACLVAGGQGPDREHLGVGTQSVALEDAVDGGHPHPSCGNEQQATLLIFFGNSVEQLHIEIFIDGQLFSRSIYQRTWTRANS